MFKRENKVQVIITVMMLIAVYALSAQSAVYYPNYDETVLLSSELYETSLSYMNMEENTEMISSLTSIPEGTDTLYVVAHGNNSGILGWNEETETVEGIGWCALIKTAVDNGVSTLVIDACSAGSAIEVAKRMRLDSEITIYTSSDVDEPSTAVTGGTSLYSQLWVEAEGEFTASYDSFGRTINPQCAVIGPRENTTTKKAA